MPDTQQIPQDLSKLSDEQLDALLAKHTQNLSDDELNHAISHGAAQDPGEEGVVNKAFDYFESGSALKDAERSKIGPIVRGAEALGKLFNDYVAQPIENKVSGPLRDTLYKAQTGKEFTGPGHASGEDIMNAGASNSGQSWETKHLSDVLPDIYSETGKGWRLQKGGALDPSAASVGGKGVELAVNPLTALSVLGAETSESSLAKGISEEAGASENATATASGAKAAMPQQDELTSLDKLSEHIEAAKNAGEKTTLPSYDAISRIEQELPDLEHKLLPIQKDAYSSKPNFDKFSAIKEMPTYPAEQFRDYEALQRNEGINKLLETTNAITDDIQPTEVERGQQAIGKILDQYKQNKDNLAPLFDQIDNVIVPPEAHGNFLSSEIGSKLGLQKYIVREADELGRPGVEKLLPYNRSMGISQGVYNTINDVLDTVNNNQLTVGELRNINRSLGTEIAEMKAPTDRLKMYQLKDAVLSHIEGIVKDQRPDLDVRNIFKDYARNEGATQQIQENILHGDLENPMKLTEAAQPEKAMKQMFSNRNNVELLKNYLGDDFNSLKGNYVQSLIDQASPNGTFSAQKFSTLLQKNAPALAEAFKENPEQLKRIAAISDFVRLFPDMPTANASGTAKQFNLMQTIKNKGVGAVFRPLETTLDVGKEALEHFSEGRKANQEWNDLLSGQKQLKDIGAVERRLKRK